MLPLEKQKTSLIRFFDTGEKQKMMGFCRKTKGAIAVFMSLILLLVFVFGCLIVDGTRILSAKSIILGAGDLAMNSALANYDTKLKDMYGLMGMKEIPEDLSEYFNHSINAATLNDSGKKYGGLIQLDTESFQLKPVNGSQVCCTEPMRQQILEYAKYRAPLAFGDEMLDKLSSVKKKMKTTEAVQQQLEVSECFKDLNDLCGQLKEKLDVHNGYCVQKPSDREIENLENQISDLYGRVALMDKIRVALSYDTPDSSLSTKETEYCVKSFLNCIETVRPETEHPEDCFSSVMKALKYQQEINTRNLDEMVNSASSEEEKKELSKLCENYRSKNRVIDQYRNKVEALEKSSVSQAYTEIFQKYYPLGDQAIQSAEDAIPVADQIIEMLTSDQSSLNSKMKEWKEKIEKLEEPDKTQQMEMYERYDELINPGSVQDMKNCLQDNIDYFQKYKAYWESFEFCEVPLYNRSEPDPAFFTKAGRYSSPKYENNQLKEEAGQFFLQNYVSWDYAETMEGMMYRNLNEHPYFKELENLLNESKNQEADGKKNNMLNEAQRILDNLFGGLDNLQDADWSGTIPSEWLSQSITESGSSEFQSMDTESNKKMVSSARKSMDESANILDSLGRLLSGMTEDMLITEYGVQMFSYFTIDKDLDGKERNPDAIISLSGFKFSDKTTAMYRSEMEYFLWGNRSAKENVKYTIVQLFAVRFLINILCAFTNSQLISETMELASGASFAAPLVQAALFLAAALMETARDMIDLLQGKPVLILKTQKTWASYYLDFSGMNKKTENGFHTLTYKEYLRIFLLLNNFDDAKQEKVLARMADCMQLNLRKVSSKALDLTQSCTMVSVVADIAINTTFMESIPRAIQLTDTNATNRYTIHYKSVLAY